MRALQIPVARPPTVESAALVLGLIRSYRQQHGVTIDAATLVCTLLIPMSEVKANVRRLMDEGKVTGTMEGLRATEAEKIVESLE